MTTVVLGGLLAATLWFAASAWSSLGEVEMSTIGVLALVLGAGVALALGAGLMFLVFYSSRKGYD